MKHLLPFFIAFLFCANHILAQGIQLDPGFGNNGQVNTQLRRTTGYSNIWDITPDQQIVVGGVAEPFQQSLLYCKYAINGDSLYGSNFYNDSDNLLAANTIKALSDGKVLVAGKELMRIDPSGFLDTTFGTAGAVSLLGMRAHDILISQENRILVAGHNTGFQGGAYVIAIDMEGNIDSTFGTNGYFRYLYDELEFFNRMIEQPDGKLLVGGCSALSSGNTIAYQTLFRFTSNGLLDPTFGNQGIIKDSFPSGGENYGIALQDDQKILVCGAQFFGSNLTGFVVRYLPNGARDTSFGLNGVVSLPMIREATDLVLLPNGNILVYGRVMDADKHAAFIQMLPNGMIDPFFANVGVYFSNDSGYETPMKMKLLNNNQIITTCAKVVSDNLYHLQLKGFLLNLNVGVVSPGKEMAMWIYPNPIQETFEVGFTLNSSQQLQFDLHDLSGKHVKTLLGSTFFETGEHTASLQIDALTPAGQYVLTISSAGNPVSTVKLLKIRYW